MSEQLDFFFRSMWYLHQSPEERDPNVRLVGQDDQRYMFVIDGKDYSLWK